MKKVILAALTLFSINTFSQATYADEAGRWRLGVNMGAMWQTSDVTPHANIAGGFTIEKILNKKADALIGFALGLRYLSGHCTGLDTKPSYGVANNTALNGSFDPQTDYAHNGGIFYNNYKTYIHEGALELKVNFPRFEQKTNLIFHIMGGVGICNYKTWINALDANGNRYDFTALQNAQSVTSADVKKLLTGTYSTLAQGSAPGGTNRFTPSVGVGFGFRLSRVVSLVFEYRVAFQRTNLLDGVDHNLNNVPIKQNDFYNYASANLLFTIYGRHNKSSYAQTPTTNTNYTNANTQTNTVYTNQQPIYNQQTSPTIYSNQQQQVYPPYVSITYPQNNFSSQGDYVTVQANVQNIQNAQQLNISQNGYPVKYYTYDAYNGNLHFQTFLQQGANNLIITANNPYGTGSQGLTIFYNPPYTPGNQQTINNTDVYGTINNNSNTQPVNTNPGLQLGTTQVAQIRKPSIQYTNPVMSPDEVTAPTFNVSALVQNITSANQLTVHLNGNPVQLFNFNPATKTLNFTATLLTGYNSVNITATNLSGSDSKSTVIDYKPVGKAPRIEIFNPATNPYTSGNQNIMVSGYVYNVSSATDIAVNFDGSPITFNYNNANHEIEIPVNLSHNSNQLQITATNAFGNDVKQQTLLFLNITTPINGGLNPTQQPQTIPVYTVNPHAVSSFTTPSQPLQNFSVTPRGNQSGVNTNTGATSGTATGASGHHNKPEFMLTSPNMNPYTSMSGVISVSANLNFAPDVNMVSVTYNGNAVSFSYNPTVSEHFSFTSPLKPGTNIFVVNAANAFGSISQNIEINYIPTNPNGNVNGNPNLHFSGGSNNTSNAPRSVNINTQQTPAPRPAQPTNVIQMQQPSGGRPVRPR